LFWGKWEPELRGGQEMDISMKTMAVIIITELGILIYLVFTLVDIVQNFMKENSGSVNCSVKQRNISHIRTRNTKKRNRWSGK
jgi:hypothetical protein